MAQVFQNKLTQPCVTFDFAAKKIVKFVKIKTNHDEIIEKVFEITEIWMKRSF